MKIDITRANMKVVLSSLKRELWELEMALAKCTAPSAIDWDGRDAHVKKLRAKVAKLAELIEVFS